LSAVSGPSSATYAYNGLGDRYQQTVGSQTTTYVLDLNTGLTQVLEDEDNAYLYGLGRVAQVNTSTEFFMGDGLGSVRQLAVSDEITLTKSYAPYGEDLYSTGSGESAFAYTGEQTDPNGLVYLRARYYSPSDGRFLSRDTWGGDMSSPQSLNRWNYVVGNPVNYTDPSGHCGRNTGINSQQNTKDCIRLAQNLESAFGIVIYWPGRNNLPSGIPNDITCYCLPTHPWDCDDRPDIVTNITYKEWKLEEVVALGASIIMYQNSLGNKITKEFLQGVVFIRANGNDSVRGLGADGQYFYPGDLRGFGDSPGIMLYDNYNEWGQVDFGDIVWVFTHEIAHRLVSWTNQKYYRKLALVEQSYSEQVWNNTYTNPQNGPTNYARTTDSIGEDIADSIATYIWERQSNWWIKSLPGFQQDPYGNNGSRAIFSLNQDRISWIESYFQGLKTLNP
jgi:RHS repeat-associated protein